MKRKIQFRGYNLKNKKWLYGYYLVNRGKSYIVQDEVVNPFAVPEDFEVDPVSVGQWVCCIKGQDFFEGDIVNTVTRYFNKVEVLKIGGSIKYCEYNNSFRVECEENRIPIIANDKIVRVEVSNGNYYTYEIIGNEYEEKMKHPDKHILK